MSFVKSIFQNLQQCTSEISKDFELKLFGSYATRLCLPWSDVDILLIDKGMNQIEEYSRTLCALISKKQNVFKDIKPEEDRIKIITTDEYKNIIINLIFQGDKPPLLKYIDLINSYLKEYTVLEPLMLALQTILKNANLNNQNLDG